MSQAARGREKKRKTRKKEKKRWGKRSRESCAEPGDLKGEASHSWVAVAAEAPGSRAMIRGRGSLCFPWECREMQGPATGQPLRAVTLRLSPRPAGAGAGLPTQTPQLASAACSPAPNFTPCLIQSPADCKLSAYLPDWEFLAGSSDRPLPSPAGCPPAHPCKPFCSSPAAPISPSGPTELILFAWSVNLNSFKCASRGLGGRTLMLKNRGLASKGAEVTGAKKVSFRDTKSIPCYKTEKQSKWVAQRKYIATQQNEVRCMY